MPVLSLRVSRIGLRMVVYAQMLTVVINTKKGNIGREIMLEVVKRREQMNPWNYAHNVDVYIKAIEQKDIKVKEQKKKTNS